MEQIKRLPLNALKFFYLVGKYGSLTMAAQQLYVTHSAVSKQLKLLEEYFGKPLFLKEGRHLKLTSEGVILYETCHSIFNELQQTTIKLKSHSKSDLIVSCEQMAYSAYYTFPTTFKFQHYYFGSRRCC